MLTYQPTPAGTSRSTVLIIGLGDTGVLVAANLSKTFRVIAVTTRPVLLSGQELGKRLTDLEYWKSCYLTPLDAFKKLDNVEGIHGQVVALNPEDRHAEVIDSEGNGFTVPWDYAVIASGITNGFWRTPQITKVDHILRELDEQNATVMSANRIGIIGGGPSATSVAFNLATTFPEKTVELFFSGDEVLPGYHPDTRRYHMKALVTKGVVVHPHHRAILPAPEHRTRLKQGTVAFTSGQPSYTGDLLIWASGAVSPNTHFLPQQMLDDAGFVRTQSDMRAFGYERVFAIGDVAATDPLRSSARNWAYRILCKNLKLLAEGKPATHQFRPPKQRWGSIVGLQSDGLTLHQQDGRRRRLSRWFVQAILWPWVVTRGIYGGIKRHKWTSHPQSRKERL
jgi:NADH dehydrogenase FAD-containing subunit